jgi:predicted ATPase
MLTEVELSNFRGFSAHAVDLSRRTLLVGANNAGKSTIVEALRLISLVANRPGLNPRDIPDWAADHAAAPFGFSPSLMGMDFELGPDIFHGLGDPPARIRGKFSSGASIEVLLGPEDAIFAVVRNRAGAPQQTAAQRDQAGITRIGVQPQVAPVQRREELRDEKYVRKALDSSLAPLHFQNQVLFLPQYWDQFKQSAETTWPGLQLNQPEVVTDYDPVKDRTVTRVRMLVRDGPFTGELSSMGHGLQMWLQMMARSRQASTLVLDEPDVYMHADLQRKLIRFVGAPREARQLIVATHSVEMMAEVDPSDIIVVDSTKKRSRGAAELSDIQAVISDLGGVHSLQYARLWNSKRCLILEGKELTLLKRVYDLLFPDAEALDVSPSIDVGGWGGWNYAVGISRFVRSADRSVSVYCLFDSDYHWPIEIEERHESAQAHQMDMCIWTRKEIESYLLDPVLLQRVIASRAKDPPAVDELREVMDEIADELKAKVVGGFMDSFPDKSKARSSVLAKTEEHLADSWTSLEGKLARVPAKEFAGLLSAWSKSECDASFGIGTLTRTMRADDVPEELEAFLKAVHGRQQLGPAH